MMVVMPSAAMSCSPRSNRAWRSGSASFGILSMTRFTALSTMNPVGSPRASCAMSPSGGLGVRRSMPAAVSARLLTSTECPSDVNRTSGRSGTMASRSLRLAEKPAPLSSWTVSQPSPGFFAAHSLMMGAIWASVSCASSKVQSSMTSEPSIRWMCASIRPGSTLAPSAFTTRVFSPMKGCAPASSPTNTMRPARTATACAVGEAGFMVSTCPPEITRSAGSTAGSRAQATNVRQSRVARMMRVFIAQKYRSSSA